MSRNTPSEQIGLSPAQRLFGRRTRTTLPTHESLLQPTHVKAEDVRQKLKERQDRQMYYYNRHTKDLKPLKIGETVRIQPERKNELWKKATVTSETSIRGYTVTTEDGRNYKRNRRHLKRTTEPCNHPDTADDPPEPTRPTAAEEVQPLPAAPPRVQTPPRPRTQVQPRTTHSH